MKNKRTREKYSSLNVEKMCDNPNRNGKWKETKK